MVCGTDAVFQMLAPSKSLEDEETSDPVVIGHPLSRYVEHGIYANSVLT